MLSVSLSACDVGVSWPNSWIWIKMKFGMQVGLGPGHIVLDGDPAPPPPKGHSRPIFGPCLLWSNGRPSQLLLSTCSMFCGNHISCLSV